MRVKKRSNKTRNSAVKKSMKKIRSDRTNSDTQTTDLTPMQILRRNPEYKQCEREKNRIRMQVQRNNLQYKSKEAEKNSVRIEELRNNNEYREKETIKDSERTREMRGDPDYQQHEAVKTYKRILEMKSDPKYREKEAVKDSERKRELRSDPDFREHEAVKTCERMVEKRKNPDYREKEATKDCDKKREVRKDPDYRGYEAAKTSERLKEVRKDPDYRQDEAEKNAKRQSQYRLKRSYTEQEQIKNKERITPKRKSNVERQKVRIADKERKRIQRTNEVCRYREQVMANVRNSEDEISKAKRKFILDSKEVPDYVCCCCQGLFFKKSVKECKTEKFFEVFNKNQKGVNSNKLDISEYSEQIESFSSGYICVTCNDSVRKGKIPVIAISRGLQFPDVPEYVSDLSDLEERMVSPYLYFMQVRDLKPHALNPQIGVKGSVVNIPVEIEDMIDVLPRRFDNLSTIQIKLKWHVEHKSHYMFETVRPTAVAKALNYLIDQELYVSRNIRLNRDFLIQLVQGDDNARLNFIINLQDAEDDKNDEVIDNKEVDMDVDLDVPEGELFTMNTCEEVLLLNRTVNNENVNSIMVIAPGQSKKPISFFNVDNLDELLFPTIYGGQKLRLHEVVTYSKRIKSELRRFDRRCCKNPRVILFKALQKLYRDVASSVGTALRKVHNSKELTAAEALNASLMEKDIFSSDLGYKFLSHIRCSPAYWKERKTDLLAMMRQLGKPTFFFTLTPGEYSWPELLICLFKLQKDKTLSVKEALELNEFTKSELIKNDPVTCVRYFNNKVMEFMKYIQSKGSPFNEYRVNDYFLRWEFQMRGSPHVHGFLWLENAPQYSEDGSQQNVINFVDRFITCSYVDDNPYITAYVHKHTHTCYKNCKSKTKICRFHFPQFVLDETMILLPLLKEETSLEVKEQLQQIKELMERYFKEQQTSEDSFEDVLQKLKLTREEYIRAIRSTIRQTKIFLKRSCKEVRINTYSKEFMIWEANTDLQFVLNEYAAITYMCDYVLKDDAGLVRILDEASKDSNFAALKIKQKSKFLILQSWEHKKPCTTA